MHIILYNASLATLFAAVLLVYHWTAVLGTFALIRLVAGVVFEAADQDTSLLLGFVEIDILIVKRLGKRLFINILGRIGMHADLLRGGLLDDVL